MTCGRDEMKVHAVSVVYRARKIAHQFSRQEGVRLLAASTRPGSKFYRRGIEPMASRSGRWLTTGT